MPATLKNFDPEIGKARDELYEAAFVGNTDESSSDSRHEKVPPVEGTLSNRYSQNQRPAMTTKRRGLFLRVPGADLFTRWRHRPQLGQSADFDLSNPLAS